MPTPKHIHDAVRNAVRSLFSELTKPQTKAVQELLIGLLKDGTAVLNHLNRATNVCIGKQSGRYRRHLENIDITTSDGAGPAGNPAPQQRERA